jgi:hypothetical protein
LRSINEVLLFVLLGDRAFVVENEVNLKYQGSGVGVRIQERVRCRCTPRIYSIKTEKTNLIGGAALVRTEHNGVRSIGGEVFEVLRHFISSHQLDVATSAIQKLLASEFESTNI